MMNDFLWGLDIVLILIDEIKIIYIARLSNKFKRIYIGKLVLVNNKKKI